MVKGRSCSPVLTLTLLSLLAGCQGLPTLSPSNPTTPSLAATQPTPAADALQATPDSEFPTASTANPLDSTELVAIDQDEGELDAAELSENESSAVDTDPQESELAIFAEDQSKHADDLWQLTRSNFQLDLDSDNARIQAQLNWYAGHPRYLDRVAQRANRYYHYVLSQVLERGLPAELALLPVVESAYDPFAYSHGRAAGPWQFIPSTGKHFGLKQTWWYDGRRDIVASTNAALDYLTQLNQRFDGDWLLALAAYNAGGGNVSKAVRRNRERGRPIDFWNLDLPKETSAYVPKLIALAKLVRDPAAYNLTLTSIPNQPYFAAVDVGSQIDLAKAAELAEVEIEELYLLNPGFNQWATDPDGPHQLLVPADSAATFSAALAAYPAEQRVTWKRYKVRSGDSLITIAKKHHTTPDTLRTANSISGNMIRAGQILLIPTASESAAVYAYSKNQRQVKKNQRIALRSGKQKLEYHVRPGDSFWKIAKAYGVGVRELASWNQMAPGDPLREGRKLVIWQPQSTLVAGNTSARQVIRKVGYTVRNGDSLYLIASKFKVSVADIKRWNNKVSNAKYLKPGQQLTLFVDVTGRN
ncbi:MAG TPA: LysM peptidoglycan-binding domain-containing protein [Motiliproteus sp.]